jgi:hypothetical protein
MLTRRRTVLLLLGLGTLALGLALPPPAGASCDDGTITCERAYGDWKQPQRISTRLGKCSGGSWGECRFRHCSNWEDSAKRACKRVLDAEHGRAQYSDDEQSGDVPF